MYVKNYNIRIRGKYDQICALKRERALLEEHRLQMEVHIMMTVSNQVVALFINGEERKFKNKVKPIERES